MSFHLAIIGAGQLARMMALDGIPMGGRFSFLAETSEATRCVEGLGDVVVRDDNMSAADIYAALGSPDVVTVEKEHVDIDLLRALAQHCAVHPNPEALEKFKNRRTEKAFLSEIGIPLAPYKTVREKEDLEAALKELAAPVFLKTEEEGYDGYNQYQIRPDNSDDVVAALEFPGAWVAEAGIAFDREVSFIATRNTAGEVVHYPPSENTHRRGTLLYSFAPAEALSQAHIDAGRRYLEAIFSATDYAGTICIECFVAGEELLANEIAPRVHNSGHWTSRGTLTSQFENHVRAVIGLPLGSPEARGISGMLNLLGVTVDAVDVCDANTFLTLYNKVTKPRRKLGHITVNGHDRGDVQARIAELRKRAYPDE